MKRLLFAIALSVPLLEPASYTEGAAARLREAAERLEKRGNDAFRTTAFHRAADSVERWPQRLRNPSRAPHGPERVLTYVDDEGIEQSCIVVTDERLSRRLPLRT